MNLDFIGDIANAIPEVTAQFNPDYQASQIEMANAEARIAEANAKKAPSSFMEGNTLYIVIAVVVLIGLFLAFNKKK